VLPLWLKSCWVLKLYIICKISQDNVLSIPLLKSMIIFLFQNSRHNPKKTIVLPCGKTIDKKSQNAVALDETIDSSFLTIYLFYTSVGKWVVWLGAGTVNIVWFDDYQLLWPYVPDGSKLTFVQTTTGPLVTTFNWGTQSRISNIWLASLDNDFFSRQSDPGVCRLVLDYNFLICDRGMKDNVIL